MNKKRFAKAVVMGITFGLVTEYIISPYITQPLEEKVDKELKQ